MNKELGAAKLGLTPHYNITYIKKIIPYQLFPLLLGILLTIDYMD